MGLTLLSSVPALSGGKAKKEVYQHLQSQSSNTSLCLWWFSFNTLLVAFFLSPRAHKSALYYLSDYPSFLQGHPGGWVPTITVSPSLLPFFYMVLFPLIVQNVFTQSSVLLGQELDLCLGVHFLFT